MYVNQRRNYEFEPSHLENYLAPKKTTFVELPESMKYYFSTPGSFCNFMSMFNDVFRAFYKSDAAELLDEFGPEIHSNMIDFLTAIYRDLLDQEVYTQEQIDEMKKAIQPKAA